MLRYPVLCCSGVQNKRLGVSDLSATCAKPGRAISREQNANATLEVSMEGTASVRKKRLSIDPGIAQRRVHPARASHRKRDAGQPVEVPWAVEFIGKHFRLSWRLPSPST